VDALKEVAMLKTYLSIIVQHCNFGFLSMGQGEKHELATKERHVGIAGNDGHGKLAGAGIRAGQNL
jgi:hypothetical protein